MQSVNFIRHIIDTDLKAGKNSGRVATRFPPEPNGYLHIGHAKSIVLNFGIAEDYHGTCNLRFDDTNPETEETIYINSIIAMVKWLGFTWQDRLYYASNYFAKLFEYAIELIKQGKAYVCDLSSEQIREYRGTLTTGGKNSPYRNRSVTENLDLFMRMRDGEFPNGAKVLRAKIDMAAPNINMRDPIMYRIRHAHHPRTGNKWCIYPTYDYTHCISDALENITHSVCTLEFEDHRPLYDWFLEQLKTPHPQQIEFARLNLTYTVMSKRKLLELVTAKLVTGWDDPRLPTLVGLKRRGFTPQAIRNFCERIGVTKQESTIEMSFLEECVREDLNLSTPRVMAVLKPLRIVITNFPENKVDILNAPYHPNDPSMGTREVPFAREIYIEQDDFLSNPPKKFFRLSPGNEVRLRYAYIIKCNAVITDPLTGTIKELHCTYDPQTRGGNTPDGRKVKGTIHWVAAQTAITAQINLYDRLFNVANPANVDFKTHLNKNSLVVLSGLVEPELAKAKPEAKFQFERLGYFCVDYNSTPQKLIFNRTVTLKDSWTKKHLS